MIVNELFTTEQVATNTPRHHSHAPMQSYVLDLELMTTEFLEPLLALPAISCVRVAPDDATNVGARARQSDGSILATLHQCVSQLVPLHKTLCGALEEASTGMIARVLPSAQGRRAGDAQVAGDQHRSTAQRTCAPTFGRHRERAQSVSGGVFLTLYKLYCSKYVAGHDFVKQVPCRSTTAAGGWCGCVFAR